MSSVPTQLFTFTMTSKLGYDDFICNIIIKNHLSPHILYALQVYTGSNSHNIFPCMCNDTWKYIWSHNIYYNINTPVIIICKNTPLLTLK